MAPLPTATPVALPEEIRNSPVLQEPMNWELRGLSTIGIALAVSISLIGIIGGLVIWIRSRQY
jgi:hypothetical protein